ncbi:hypothetical protein HW115_00895 [Verrucomicrobiaceae bacterium N1E253]|uniref:Uncharacterized protein n=1 Tax=Oceaniferula marina TaxID=2748318 RepID=A0A851GEK8_9BACT|nr:hypothetical protein [Oceaniferula marina]NWK54151.1 hypothetical protein [Oceaniferula marina]
MRVAPVRGKRSTFVPPVKGVDATLVFAEWADMQPEKFGPIADDNVVDRALVAVAQWNKQHPDQKLRVRLRTFSGIYAPDWVLDHAGSVEVDYRKKVPAKPVIRSTPKFWTAAYAEAWVDFQKKMAARYDCHDLLGDVSISGNMTLHTEVMWRQPGFPNVLPALMKAGLTRENELACLKADITRFMEIWDHTPVEMTFNTRRKYVLDSSGKTRSQGSDVEFVTELMNHMAKEGKRLNKKYMIGNHSLSENSVLLNKRDQDAKHVLYALKKEHLKRQTPLYFQTEVFSAHIAGGLIREGFRIGATLVELPNDMTKAQILTPEIQALRTELKKQANQ